MLERTSKDLNTMTGQNIRHILDKIDATHIFEVNPRELKNSYKFDDLPVEEEWKVNIIKDITDVQHCVSALTKPSDDEDLFDEPPLVEFTNEELEEILVYVCTS